MSCFLWAVGLTGCGAASVSYPDAHVDAASPDGGASDVTPEVGMCGPPDGSTYTPDMMHAPNPPHANACSSQQASDYADCQAGMSSKCTEFGVGQTAYMCGQCIESQKTDVHWGVVVFDNAVGTLNIEGCVDDALMQVPYEKASMGSGLCGDLLYALYGCQDQACGSCGADQIMACTTSANAGTCASYKTAVESQTGVCKVLLGDAAPPASLNCFPNGNITDPAMQRTDWITRMAQYMCGP